MTEKQMNFLKEIHISEKKSVHFMEWTIEGITEQDVQQLIDGGFVTESIGEGFCGGLRTLKLTDKGEDIAKSYCDSCGCLPCDCLWGYE